MPSIEKRKKNKKIKKNNNDNSQKNENSPINKKLKKKRKSIDTRKLRHGKGLDKIFIRKRNLSIKLDMSLIKANNAIKKKKE